MARAGFGRQAKHRPVDGVEAAGHEDSPVWEQGGNVIGAGHQ